MSDKSRKRLGQVHRLVKWSTPHVTWLLGVSLIIESILERNWTVLLVENPEGTVFLWGLMLFFAGRDALGYRKQFRKEKRRRERLEEDYEEFREEYYDEIGA